MDPAISMFSDGTVNDIFDDEDDPEARSAELPAQTAISFSPTTTVHEIGISAHRRIPLSSEREGGFGGSARQDDIKEKNEKEACLCAFLAFNPTMPHSLPRSCVVHACSVAACLWTLPLLFCPCLARC